jgi:hypothetical protein
MVRSRVVSVFIVAFIVSFGLVGCMNSKDGPSGGDQGLPEDGSSEVELVPLVEIPTSWRMVGEIIYNDEFGETDFLFEGDFVVEENDQLSGNGTGQIVHDGPCHTLTRSYEFDITGEYASEANVFIFYKLFGEGEDYDDEDGGHTTYLVDNTFVTCTVGESAGEAIAMLRPIFLLAETDHGELENGHVPVPVTNEGAYSIEFPGGVFILTIYKDTDV